MEAAGLQILAWIRVRFPNGVQIYGLIAQLNRALDYGSRGWEFESL